MHAFLVLTAEAFRDGLRRRLALVVAVTLVIGLASAQSCTQMGVGDVRLGEQAIDAKVIAGFLAPLLYLFQALNVLAIAVLVAADHLARPLAEGNAVLWLARPVSRRAWAGARLAGALAIALLAGLVLLGGTGAMLIVRQGVGVVPALAGAAATALGAVVMASLAMAASLLVGRSAVVLVMLLALSLVVVANGIGIATTLAHAEVELGGVLGAIDRFGPPLLTSIAAGVAPWNPHVEPGEAFPFTMGRLALWAIAGIALVLVLFQRREIEA